MLRNLIVCGIGVGLGVLGALAPPAMAQVQDRVSATEKGSLIVFSKVELRWNSAGEFIQDTFVDLSNDYPASVAVQLYFVNGDPPLEATATERAHPGWNFVDCQILLTQNEPAYWSVLTGQPKGVSPFTALDPGSPPGRPDPHGSADRVLRGFVVGFAINPIDGAEISWNHLKGDVTIVNYGGGYAWEYNGWAFQVVSGVPHGAPTGSPGVLNLDGLEFARSFDLLMLDFYAEGSAALSTAGTRVVSLTDLTLHPVSVDLRHEGSIGPVSTEASFEIWNQNEVKFSGTKACIRCWDQRLLSHFGTPNHFLLQNLQTDKGKARIDGLPNAACSPPPAGPGTPAESASLLGVAAKLLTFHTLPDLQIGSNRLPAQPPSVVQAAAGTNLVGMGYQGAIIRFNQVSPPPPMPPLTGDPKQIIEMILEEVSPIRDVPPH